MANIAIIVAAGSGLRMNTDLPKQFLSLKGTPIICHTLQKFENCDKIDKIIIVIKKQYETFLKQELKKYNFKKIYKIIFGGEERFNSVYNAISAIEDKNSIVLIHDAVRPFIKIEHIINVIETTKVHKACILAVKAKDTIKICQNDCISYTPNRENIFLAQTPQAFEYDIIKKAYDYALQNNIFATDDASIAESFGVKVKIILGDYENIKITTKEDLKIAKLFF